MSQRNAVVSEKKRLANQRNAQKSTGPRTAEGKHRSAQNAITHGLFVYEVVLPNESVHLFRAMRLAFIQDLKPQGIGELAIVDQMVCAQWKLRRSQLAESLKYGGLAQEMVQQFIEKQTEYDLQRREQELKEYKEKLLNNSMLSAMIMGRFIANSARDELDRLSKYEQRHQNTVHRCFRQLRELRKDRKLIDELPDSPYEASALIDPPPPEEGEEQSRGYKPEEEEQEVKEQEQEKEKEEASHTSKAQNEPTAPASAEEATICEPVATFENPSLVEQSYHTQPPQTIPPTPERPESPESEDDGPATR